MPTTPLREMQLSPDQLRERLEPLFQENFDRFGELGAAVSIWQNGKPVVELCVCALLRHGSRRLRALEVRRATAEPALRLCDRLPALDDVIDQCGSFASLYVQIPATSFFQKANLLLCRYEHCPLLLVLAD